MTYPNALVQPQDQPLAHNCVTKGPDRRVRDTAAPRSSAMVRPGDHRRSRRVERQIITPERAKTPNGCDAHTPVGIHCNGQGGNTARAKTPNGSLQRTTGRSTPKWTEQNGLRSSCYAASRRRRGSWSSTCELSRPRSRVMCQIALHGAEDGRELDCKTEDGQL